MIRAQTINPILTYLKCFRFNYGFQHETVRTLIDSSHFAYKSNVCLIRFQSLMDVGYFHIGNKAKNATERQHLINRSIRLRYVGEKIPPPFPNGWFALMESADLKRGEAKNVDCLGHNFAIFRNENGAVHILDAYCSHMGANLGRFQYCC